MAIVKEAKEAKPSKDSKESKEHLLSAALRVWADIKSELEEKPADKDAELAETAPVPTEELKKVAKWVQHTVTKFAASAAVADGPKDPALKSVAEEVVKSFTAALGTLLSIRRGAGPSLRAELRDLAASLSKAVDALGAAVGTPGMATCAGQVLDRVKHFERVSSSNRAAMRRKILTCLTQVRDANKELTETLKEKAEGDGDDSDEDLDLDDDFGGEDELEPEERVVMEAVAVVSGLMEEVLKKASTACSPSASSGASPAPIAELEAVAVSASSAQKAIDSLVANGLGGMDVKAVAASLEDLRQASGGVSSTSFAPEAGEKLKAAIDAIQTALDAVPSED